MFIEKKSLQMNRLAFGDRSGFHHGFAPGWVRVDGLGDRHACCSVGAANDEFFDHLSGFVTNNMRAQNLIVLRADDELDETFGLTHSAGFAERSERELADLVGDTGFFCRRLGHAGACDLRLAISATGYVVVIERVRVLACEM